MKNIKKLYLYFTLNKFNIIILLASLLCLFFIFLFNKQEVSIYDYNLNRSSYNKMFISDNLFYIELITLITLCLLISIDFMTNQKFDIIFMPKYSKISILKSQILSYLFIMINFISISLLLLVLVLSFRYSGFKINLEVIRLYLYLLMFGFEIILITLFNVSIFKYGFLGLITILLYFMSNIIYDISTIFSNILLFHIDLYSFKNTVVGIIISCFICFIIIFVLYKIYGNKNKKEVKN